MEKFRWRIGRTRTREEETRRSSSLTHFLTTAKSKQRCCCGGCWSGSNGSWGSGIDGRSFHRLSWTVAATVHVALAILVAREDVPWTSPLLTIRPPASPWLRIHRPLPHIPYVFFQFISKISIKKQRSYKLYNSQSNSNKGTPFKEWSI